MRPTLSCLLAIAAVAVPIHGRAEPDRADKTDAKALMASGLKLFAAKDYLGALAVFQNAYARFPSAKILLNIATTQKALGRNADAANSYQRFLDAGDVDPARKAEVAKVLAGLDATLGIVAITVAPADAEVQLGDEAWRPASEVHELRAAPGELHIRARRDEHTPAERTVVVAAGARADINLALAAIPVTVHPVVAAVSDTGVRAAIAIEPPLSRFGAIALANVDVIHKGGAGVVGLTVAIAPHLQLEAAAILGPTAGAYAGARIAFLDGNLRPLVALGMPVFASGGARFALRGAAGIELALTRHVALVAEVGVEHVLNPQANVAATVFVPAIGAAARL